MHRLSLPTALLLVLSLSIVSCSKSIPSTESLTPLTPAATDANAGSWKMIVLSSPTQVPVAAPAAATTPAYQAELASIKSAQSAITPAQQTAITYWSAGGVLRWNEIMRELCARQDLPPSPNPDGSYGVPSAANPFANPQYPFSNPPYAARAYSYVSVAQFEALKAAWYYKYQYNRPSPFKADPTIKDLMPDSAIPSYPSEDASSPQLTMSCSNSSSQPTPPRSIRKQPSSNNRPSSLAEPLPRTSPLASPLANPSPPSSPLAPAATA